MHISLSPQRRDDTLSILKSRDILTFNGVEYDFSVIPDGATLPRDAVDCPWLVDDIHRIDGVLHLKTILPLAADASAAARFPAPIVDPADGVLEFPK